MVKWIIGIIVVILIAAALWWGGVFNSFMSPATSPTATTTAPVATTSQQASQPTQADIAQQNGMSNSSDNSDAAISQDTASIDTQMQGLNSDNTSANSSFNDQPVQQSY